MNTIENLIKILRRDADHHSSLGIMAAPAYLRAIADMAEQIKPRYRPPQPSDDGKWCFLEQFSDYEPCPYKIVQHDDDMWWCVPLRGTKKFRLTGNVWPCERPEMG